MANIIEAFVAFDTSKLRNAVAIAEAGRAGEVRFLGEIENTEVATAKLVMTQVPWLGLTPRSPAMAGSDTFAIDVSSTFMKVASDSATVPTASCAPLSGGGGAGGAAGRVAGGPVTTAARPSGRGMTARRKTRGSSLT